MRQGGRKETRKQEGYRNEMRRQEVDGEETGMI